MMSVRTRRWIVPLIMLVGGGAITLGSAVGGDSAGDLAALAGITVAASVAYVLIGLTDSDFGALLASSADERQANLNIQATAFAGGVMAVAIIIGAVVELALGHNGQPWVLLGAGYGVAYLAALAILRRR